MARKTPKTVLLSGDSKEMEKVVGVNRVRDQARAALSTEERTLLFG